MKKLNLYSKITSHVVKTINKGERCRGKEIKRVEFEEKVHKMMVGGIGFIEYWSYDPIAIGFHEGVRTVKTIWKHRRYFGKGSNSLQLYRLRLPFFYFSNKQNHRNLK